VTELVAGLDAGFLLTETSTMPWHVLGVLVLDRSTAAEEFTVDGIRRLVAARLDMLEAFRKVVRAGPWGLLPHWTDGEVDLEAHVRLEKLPPDAGLAGLAQLAATMAEDPLDRRRPLWELRVVEHLDGDRAAVVAKLHHALADGISAVGLLAGLLDLEPRSPGPPSRELVPASPPRAPSLVEWPREVAEAAVSTAKSVVPAVRHAIRFGTQQSFAFRAPRTTGHRPLTSRRRAAFGSMAVEAVRQVREAFGVTFHDVVLAAVTGAARSWLVEADDLPDQSLLAVVPTSTRGRDSRPMRSRNQVSALFVSLPVHVADPLERLRLIADDTVRSKMLHDAAGPTTLGTLAAVAPWPALSLLWRASWWVGTARMLPPVANLLVTSVPGPPVPLYLAGARLVGLYPLGPILQGIPLNLTAVSREDRIEVGILACPDLVPDVDNLASRIPLALAELVAIAPASCREGRPT
jgi:WS/DGAT/MGAT family acyltransferase